MGQDVVQVQVLVEKAKMACSCPSVVRLSSLSFNRKKGLRIEVLLLKNDVVHVATSLLHLIIFSSFIDFRDSALFSER